MAEAALGSMVRKHTIPTRGERVAAATVHFMKARGMTPSELAFQAQIDKRDLQRLLLNKNCGPRLEDSLEAFFGWNFTEMVAEAVHGADPLTAREAHLATMLTEAAALKARVDRERALRAADPAALGGVAAGSNARGVRAARERRAFVEPTPAVRRV